MARCRHDADAGPWLGLSIDLFERGARKVGDVRQVGVVILFARVRDLALLHEDRRPGEVAGAPPPVGGGGGGWGWGSVRGGLGPPPGTPTRRAACNRAGEGG